MKKNTLIQVTWNDIIEEAGWTEEKDIDDSLYECKTLGYFFKKTDKQLIISCTVATSGKTRNFTKIPLGCIENIRVLTVGHRVRNIHGRTK